MVNNSKEKTPIEEEIIKNQRENPADTAKAFILELEESILNWVNKRYKASLR